MGCHFLLQWIFPTLSFKCLLLSLETESLRIQCHLTLEVFPELLYVSDGPTHRDRHRDEPHGSQNPLHPGLALPLTTWSLCILLPPAPTPPPIPSSLGLVSQFSSVQFSHSVVSDSLWPRELAARQASLSITNSQSLLKLMAIESVVPFNHLILCRPLFLPPSVFPSIRVFSN